MKKISLLPLFALVLAFAASAFTDVKNNTSDIIWFELDPDTGVALNPSSGGVQSVADPYSCEIEEEDYCSVALSVTEGTAIDEGGGVYSIAEEIDYLDPVVHEALRFQEPE